MVLANHLSTVTSKICGVDKPDEVLTFLYADHTASYRDDFYSGCQNTAGSGTTYISGMDTLILFLSGASRYEAVPTEFDTLDFFVSPIPSKDLSWMEGCQWGAESEYIVEASTRRLSWSLCRSPAPGAAFARLTGSRALNEAEYASLQAGLASLVLGASGDCTTSRADKWISISRENTFASFTSDVGACSRDRNGTPPFVIGLDAVVQTVAGMVEAGK